MSLNTNITPVVLVFPGQGSQYVGMGGKSPSLQQSKLWDLAHDALGFQLKTLCLEGPDEKLAQTQFTQTALFTYSALLLEILNPLLNQLGMKVSMVLGHSVGEYAALYAAKVIDFKTGAQAVNQRGLAMQGATPLGVGGMYALLKAPLETIEQLCLKFSQGEEKVWIANYNSNEQIVISGHLPALEKLTDYLKEHHKSVKAIKLNVSAPFHSPLMLAAQNELQLFFSQNPQSIKPNSVPYIANVDAEIYPAETAPHTIEKNLIEQIASPVKWLQSMNKIPINSVVIEVGAGRVLTNLIKRCRPDLQAFSFDSIDFNGDTKAQFVENIGAKL